MDVGMHKYTSPRETDPWPGPPGWRNAESASRASALPTAVAFAAIIQPWFVIDWEDGIVGGFCWLAFWFLILDKGLSNWYGSKFVFLLLLFQLLSAVLCVIESKDCADESRTASEGSNLRLVGKIHTHGRDWASLDLLKDLAKRLGAWNCLRCTCRWFGLLWFMRVCWDRCRRRLLWVDCAGMSAH